MIYQIYLLCRKYLGIKNHDMIWRQNHFIYVDYYGQIWKVIPTHRADFPFQIELLDR